MTPATYQQITALFKQLSKENALDSVGFNKDNNLVVGNQPQENTDRLRKWMGKAVKN